MCNALPQRRWHELSDLSQKALGMEHCHPPCICRARRREGRLMSCPRSLCMAGPATLGSLLPNMGAGPGPSHASSCSLWLLLTFVGSGHLHVSISWYLILFQCPQVHFQCGNYSISLSKQEDLKGGPLFSMSAIIYVHK